MCCNAILGSPRSDYEGGCGKWTGGQLCRVIGFLVKASPCVAKRARAMFPSVQAAIDEFDAFDALDMRSCSRGRRGGRSQRQGRRRRQGRPARPGRLPRAGAAMEV